MQCHASSFTLLHMHCASTLGRLAPRLLPRNNRPLRRILAASITANRVHWPRAYSMVLPEPKPTAESVTRPSDILISDRAAEKLREVLRDESSPTAALRILVDAGGCHGYQYKLDIVPSSDPDDHVYEVDGARVVIDPISLPLMAGSRLEWVEELIGSTFKVQANPRASGTCGCDVSFEIK